MSETEATAINCAFCSGPAVHLKLPGADAWGCASCGAIGPADQGDEGPDRIARALQKWNTRGGIGRARVALVREGVSPDACIVAESLYGVADKLYTGELGSLDVYLLLLFDSKLKRLHIQPHRLDEIGMLYLASEFIKILNEKRAAAKLQAGGLILPGR